MRLPLKPAGRLVPWEDGSQCWAVSLSPVAWQLMVVSPQDGMMLNKPICWGCASLPGHRVLLQWCRSSHCSLLCPCTSDSCAAACAAECVLHHKCSVFWRHCSFFRMVAHVSNSTVFIGKGETNVKIRVWRELVLLTCWRSSLLHCSFSLDELGHV